MKIKILGSGCTNCQRLEKTVKEVLEEMGVEATIEKVKDIKKIMEYPILTTPGLVIDEKLVSSGKVPGKEEIARIIHSASGIK